MKYSLADINLITSRTTIVKLAYEELQLRFNQPWCGELVPQLYSCFILSRRTDDTYSPELVNKFIMTLRTLCFYFDLCEDKTSTIWSLRSLESQVEISLKLSKEDWTDHVTAMNLMLDKAISGDKRCRCHQCVNF